MIGQKDKSIPAILLLAFILGCGERGGAASNSHASRGSASSETTDGHAASGGASSTTSTNLAATGASWTGSAGSPASDTDGAAGAFDGATSGSTAGASGSTAHQPYANIVAVGASGDAGNYVFSVSVESADVDCTQYADWWEVLSEEGLLIYRRILTHSHTDDNGTTDQDAPGNTFTRDGGPVEIAADQVVVVRAHMNSVPGYNGVVMRGSVAAGFLPAPDVGFDFAAAVENDPPQPATCLF